MKTIFGRSINTVVSHIETSIVEPTLPIEPNQHTADNFSHRRKISPEKEHWDASLSPQKDPPRYTLFKNRIYIEIQGENEDHDEVRNDDEEEVENQNEATFGFPILGTTKDVNMKNIPPSSLPTFYGKSNEDPDTFLFEFHILCRSYNYLQDAHKIKLFPSTLKYFTLQCVTPQF